MKAKLLANGKFTIEKGGHTDGHSAVHSCKTIMSHCQMILDNIDIEADGLPTWWTNKLAVSEYEGLMLIVLLGEVNTVVIRL